MHIILSVQKLFTGKDWMKEVVVEIENGIIKNIRAEGYDANNAMPIVIPALIDLQIYGAENKFAKRNKFQIGREDHSVKVSNIMLL